MKQPTRWFALLSSAAMVAACSVSPPARPDVGIAVEGGSPVAMAGAAQSDAVASDALAGRVRLAGLDPAGLLVTAYLAEAPKGAPSMSTVTDAEGRFRLLVPAGRYNVVVRQPGTNLAAVRFGVQAGVVLDIDLVPTGTLSGRVSGPAGANLVGTDVFVPGTDIQGKTDAEGLFVLRNVPVGLYTVGATRPGYSYGAVEGIEVSATETALVEGLVIGRDRKVGRIEGDLKVPAIMLAAVNRGEPVDRSKNYACFEGSDWAAMPNINPDYSQMTVTVVGTDGSTTPAVISSDGRFAALDVTSGPVLLIAKGPGLLDAMLGQTVFPDATIRPTLSTAPKSLVLASPPGPLAVSTPYRLSFARNNRFLVDRHEPSPDWIWTSSDTAIATVSEGVVTGLATGTVEVSVRDPQDSERFATASVRVDGIPYYATDAVRLTLDGRPMPRASMQIFAGYTPFMYSPSNWAWRSVVSGAQTNVFGYLSASWCSGWGPYAGYTSHAGYLYEEPASQLLPATQQGLDSLVVVAAAARKDVSVDVAWQGAKPEASASLDVSAPAAFQFSSHPVLPRNTYRLRFYDAKRAELTPTFSKPSDADPGVPQSLAADLAQLPGGSYFYRWTVDDNIGFGRDLLQSKLVPFTVATGSANPFGTLDPYGVAGSSGPAELLPPDDDGHLGRLYLSAADGKVSLGYPSSRTYKVRVPLADGGSSGLAYWQSSDPAVATVDQAGKVTAKARGRATISVVPADYLRHRFQPAVFEVEVKAVTDISVEVE